MDSADVVIVGGGIVGSAVAYFLSSDGAFQGRRVVLIERDPSYAEGSTARSAGGLRQQFSTPENIAMSQFTLALIRRLKTVFGPDADVAFREQGYLIMGGAEGAALLAENVALAAVHGADIALMEAAELAHAFPWLATEGVAAGAFGRSGEGWFDPPSLASLLRNAAKARGVTVLHDRVTGIDARRPHRGRAAGERRQDRMRRARQRGGRLGRASWRRWPACRCRSSRASATST